MWPFDKKKAAQAQQAPQAAAQNQQPPRPKPPEFTQEDWEKQRELGEEHQQNIKKFRLKQFGMLPCHVRQEIVDSIRSWEFYDNFFSADDLVKKPQELVQLERKRAAHETWERIQEHDRSYHSHIYGPDFGMRLRDDKQQYVPRFHDYRFILEAGITIEELEKIHYDNTAQEELLDTDTRDE